MKTTKPNAYVNHHIEFHLKSDALYYRWVLPSEKSYRIWSKIDIETLVKSNKDSPMTLLTPGIAMI